ncbi:MAG TPA: branched-chain amino acid ABC transporter permease, partial [Candidatus Baltobacteraceae bacterium]|nr:branched-chain amino acid ABC transporter permease [Candidatus Baltobacteraceae bacterium]
AFVPLLAQAQYTPDYLGTQLFNGLVNGGFFALLALGLSIIFGMLRIVNFAHGVMNMLGAFVAYYGAQLIHLPFFAALIVAPILVGLFGLLIETTLLRRLYGLDPLYILLFTFALVLMIEDGMRIAAGALGSPYETPSLLAGATNLGFTLYPTYRLFVIIVCIVVCVAVYYGIERTMLGARIRAATEKPELTRAFGIDTSRLVSGVFAFGVALAAFAGVLNAPNTNVSPTMGDTIIIQTFAIVVIGGLGSILGSIVAGFAVGVIATIGAVFFPQISSTLIFILMVLVLIVRPAGLFGTTERTA